MIREKQITIIKMRIKVNIKIKLNQILRNEIEKKKNSNKICSNQKFEDQIWHDQQIIWYFKNFHNFWKVFSAQNKRKTLFWKSSQIFLWHESVLRWPESVFRWPTFLTANKHRKVWKVIFENHFPENKRTLNDNVKEFLVAWILCFHIE